VFTPMLQFAGYGILGREPTFDHMSCRFGHQDGYGVHLRFYR
jgi:hypothetical protein